MAQVRKPIYRGTHRRPDDAVLAPPLDALNPGRDIALHKNLKRSFACHGTRRPG
jgi:hypothetical protein